MLLTEGQLATKTMGGIKNVQFEDALNMTGFGKFNYLSLFVCCSALLAMGMEIFGISFIATASACDLEMTVAQRGILTAMPLLGTVIMSYPWGYITDTRGRRQTLILSMSCGFVFSTLSSFAPNLTTFCVFKFLSATFASAANACTYTMLGEFQPKSQRDKMLMFLTSAMMAVSLSNGFLSYPVLTYLKFSIPIPFLGITYGPWRLLVVVLAIPMAFSALCLSWLEESPKFLISQGRAEDAMKVLRRIYAINTGKDASTYPVDSLIFTEETNKVEGDTFLRSLWKQFAPLFHKRFLKYTLALYCIQFTTYAVSNSYSLWLPYISNNFQLGLEQEDAYINNFCSVVADPDRESKNVMTGECNNTIAALSFIVPIVYSALNCVFNSAFVLVVKCVGKKVFMIGCLIFCGICGLIINWISNPIAGFILFILFNFVCLVMGLVPAYAVEIYPTYLRGMSVCMLLMVARIGAVIGTNILGIIFESHCVTSFYIFSIAIIVTAFACLLLPSDSHRKNKILPEDEVTKL